MKRTLSIALVFMVIFSLLSVLPVANAIYVSDALFEDGFYYVIDCDQAYIMSYKGDAEHLVIPKTLGGYPVIAIGEYAFYSHTLTSITIGDNITMIDVGAFAYCYNLESINVESGSARYYSDDGVLLADDNTWVYACPRAKSGSYVMPDTVKHVDQQAFFCCSLLESVTISPNVVSIGQEAFALCTSLTNVVIPDSVDVIYECAFWGCDNLETIVMSENIEQIGSSVFDNTPKLTVYAPYNCNAYRYALNNGVNVKATDVPEGTTTPTNPTTENTTEPTTANDEFKFDKSNKDVWIIIGVVIAMALVVQVVAVFIVMKKKKV